MVWASLQTTLTFSSMRCPSSLWVISFFCICSDASLISGSRGTLENTPSMVFSCCSCTKGMSNSLHSSSLANARIYSVPIYPTSWQTFLWFSFSFWQCSSRSGGCSFFTFTTESTWNIFSRTQKSTICKLLSLNLWKGLSTHSCLEAFMLCFWTH